MMSKMMCAAAVALLAGAIGTRADETKPVDLPFDDARFVQMAASDGMHEVELGKIGAAHTKNDDVKKFAERMVKDHSKANDDLKIAAKAADLPVPSKINETHQKHIDMFKDYKGTNFDADYMKHMVFDHTEALVLFARASKEAKNKDIQDFATRTLPVVQDHLEQAQKISKSLK